MYLVVEYALVKIYVFYLFLNSDHNLYCQMLLNLVINLIIYTCACIYGRQDIVVNQSYIKGTREQSFGLERTYRKI